MHQNRNTKSPSESKISESSLSIVMTGMPREYGENAGPLSLYSARSPFRVLKSTIRITEPCAG
jgi:hypothetical protein